LGLALLTKFTLLILLPVFAALAVLSRWSKPAGQTRWHFRVWAVQALTVMAFALLVVNLGYECVGTCHKLKDFRFVSKTFAGASAPTAGPHTDNRFRGTWLGELVVPVPADYLLGIDLQRRDFEVGFHSYLAGQWRRAGEGGWWYYYLYALAVKLPLGFWGLFLGSLGLAFLRHPSRAAWWEELFLGLPALTVLAVVSSQTGFNHHMRYVLPLFPFLIIGTGKLAFFLQPGRWRSALLVAALLFWGIGSSLAVYPHSLSYFNELAGGPDNGGAHLIDSNLDWGQDLQFLKRWLERHPEARPLGLAYFGQIDPRLVGIQFRLPPPGPPGRDVSAGSLGPRPGFYAVSANFIHGLVYSAADGTGGQRAIPFHAYEYFSFFKPMAKAGYSIFIYHISLAEADRVRRRIGLDRLGESPAGGENVVRHGP
jgi:hypothetical protein